MEGILKKSYVFLIIIAIIAIGIGLFIYNYNKNNSSNNNSSVSYNATKVGTIENNTTNNVTQNSTNDNKSQNSTINENTTNNETKEETETEIASFTTTIYTKDSKRQNNMSITCSSLNNTFINNGETFSFCDTVGKATSSKGYEKADVFQDGEKIKALGGGNCQVSSTLYNAVLKIPELKVTERHEHSNTVPYVSKGKDAAVAFGSYDFKFENQTGSKIKITASCDKDYVYTKIFKVE